MCTASQIAEMRDWIADCYWGDLDDPSVLTDAQVVHGISVHYHGGVSGFLADAILI